MNIRDEIIGKQFNVLDNGFIRVIDCMGSDDAIVQAARISYGKGTKRIHEDRGLIRYLMRHGHTTPFEMCEIKFHVRVPMDCWRQWIRHRTANVNEYSTRYSEAIDAAQKTAPDAWRKQSSNNRQGSQDFIDPKVGIKLSQKEAEFHRLSREIYAERLHLGIAREQARKELPLATYTEAYWKIDLHNLLHFLALRMAENAQFEIRSYANVIGNEIVQKWCPISWEAFLDYRLHGITLSRPETEILSAILSNDPGRANVLAIQYGWISEDESAIKPNRERSELESKLKRFGLAIPWATK